MQGVLKLPVFKGIKTSSKAMVILGVLLFTMHCLGWLFFPPENQLIEPEHI